MMGLPIRVRRITDHQWFRCEPDTGTPAELRLWGGLRAGLGVWLALIGCSVSRQVDSISWWNWRSVSRHVEVRLVGWTPLVAVSSPEGGTAVVLGLL